MHQLIHDESGAGHVPGVFHYGKEKIQYQYVRQEHKDTPHSRDDPIDEEILEEATRRYRSIITIEDGTVMGGLGTAVAEWIALHHRDTRLRMLGVQDEFVHQGTVAQLHERCGMDAKSLEETIKLLLDK
jgi:hypothetical protein